MLLEDRVERLERRNAALERQNRHLWRGGLASLAVVGAALLMGQAPPGGGPQTIEARLIVLRDEAGKERVRLGASQEAVGITIMDQAGNKRASLGERNTPGQGEMVGLWFFGPNGKPQVGVGAGPQRQGIFQFDEQGRPVDQGR